MKYLLIFSIALYQKLFSPFVKQVLGVSSQCKFPKTCSEYAKNAINKYGVAKGSVLSLQRLARCQPFFSFS